MLDVTKPCTTPSQLRIRCCNDDWGSRVYGDLIDETVTLDVADGGRATELHLCEERGQCVHGTRYAGNLPEGVRRLITAFPSVPLSRTKFESAIE